MGRILYILYEVRGKSAKTGLQILGRPNQCDIKNIR